jgi:hypothetical protein
LHVPLQQQPPSQTKPNQTAIKEPTKGKGLGRYKHRDRHTGRQTDRQKGRNLEGRKNLERRRRKKKKVVDETTT